MFIEITYNLWPQLFITLRGMTFRGDDSLNKNGQVTTWASLQINISKNPNLQCSVDIDMHKTTITRYSNYPTVIINEIHVERKVCLPNINLKSLEHADFKK